MPIVVSCQLWPSDASSVGSHDWRMKKFQLQGQRAAQR